MLYWITKTVEAFTVFVVFIFWWALSYSLLKALADSMLNRLIARFKPSSEDIKTVPFWKGIFKFSLLYPVGIGFVTFVFYLCYFLQG